MVSLKAWMRGEALSDAAMAERIGGVSAETVRKLRFRTRGASPRVAARIFAVTKGAVEPPDMVPVGSRHGRAREVRVS